jgi:hypothetical protein
MAAHARIERASAGAATDEDVRSVTARDVAGWSLRYWWVVVGLWLAYSAWMFQSVARDIARYR